MSVLLSNETELASEKGFCAGEIGFNSSCVSDAFDIYLAKRVSGDLAVIIFMKLQFDFKDGNIAKWTEDEKQKFVTDWKQAVSSAWGNRIIKKLKSGKDIYFDLRFKTQIGGWMWDHWEIEVTKTSKFQVSYVTPKKKSVTLDSLDLTLTPKKGGGVQRGAVHEFGHMLGLKDEYHSSSQHKNDYQSVMNSAESIRPRHDSVYLSWLNQKLKDLKIE